MEWASEDVFGSVEPDASGWAELGRGPTDSLLEEIER